jgi:hypothetical protein
MLAKSEPQRTLENDLIESQPKAQRQYFAAKETIARATLICLLSPACSSACWRFIATACAPASSRRFDRRSAACAAQVEARDLNRCNKNRSRV